MKNSETVKHLLNILYIIIYYIVMSKKTVSLLFQSVSFCFKVFHLKQHISVSAETVVKQQKVRYYVNNE